MDREPALLQGWSALKAGAFEAALTHLDAPFTDPGLEARRWAFRAQAYSGLGRVNEAERAAAEAVRWAKREPGGPGVEAIRGLHARILASVAAAQIADKEAKADEALLQRATADVRAEGLDVLLRRANILAKHCRFAEAEADARTVWQESEGPRDRVLAALTLARLDPSGDWIALAHQVADASEDQNLMTAVAHAARIAGVTLQVIGR